MSVLRQPHVARVPLIAHPYFRMIRLFNKILQVEARHTSVSIVIALSISTQTFCVYHYCFCFIYLFYDQVRRTALR